MHGLLSWFWVNVCQHKKYFTFFTCLIYYFTFTFLHSDLCMGGFGLDLSGSRGMWEALWTQQWTFRLHVRQSISNLSSYKILKMECTPCSLLLICSGPVHWVKTVTTLVPVVASTHFPFRNDENTAKDYKVQGGSVLHLVLALRGGNWTVCWFKNSFYACYWTFIMVIMALHPGNSACNYFVHT